MSLVEEGVMLFILSPPHLLPFFVNNLCIILAVPEQFEKVQNLTGYPIFVILKVEGHRKCDRNRLYDALLHMKKHKKQNNFGEIQEKAMSWIWVVLLISTIMFLKGLLSDMHTETTRLSDERVRFQEELTREREKSQEIYQEFYAELDESIKRAMEALKSGY